MTLELSEIQGIVLSGYGERPCARFGLFAIDDVARARVWLRELLERVQFAEFMATAKGQAPFLSPVCINIAFTHQGLQRLGLPPETRLGFSGSFRGGMAAPHRARQLGDDGDSAPERWLWGGPETPEVHGVLLVYAGEEDGDASEDERCLDQLARELTREHGLSAILTRETLPMRRDNRAEHFGFADGISNPTLLGLKKPHHRDVIADGEVLLGYPNAYGKLGLSPLVPNEDPLAPLLPRSRSQPSRGDFGRNGSYLVFRELSQDVAAFWQFMSAASERLPEARDPIWVASRMVGRWPNGLPVTRYPEVSDPHQHSDENDFGYHDQDDFYGGACPIGSHIRRTRPRETLLPLPHDPPLCHDVRDAEQAKLRASVADRHRLLRRGRSYGPRRSERFDLEQLKQPDGHARGLHFLCVVANLRRQFEFVQGSWIVNPNFAGLSRDPDPLLAARRHHPFDAHSFVLPGCPARFVDEVPRLVETRGGGYFFLPSRSALRYLAALEQTRTPAHEAAPSALVRELEALERDKVERAFARERSVAGGRRARRAFHAQAHGIVRAELEVDPDLPEPWQTGLFRPGARYPAWVRFSSAAFAPHGDHERDLHGLAIKLMNVPDLPRASAFEARTQDFVLVDAPRLMVRDLEQLLAFERAQVRGGLLWVAHLARHPQQLRDLLAITSAPSHPLARSYNSITPFAYGSPDRVVRWVVRLRQAEALVALRPGPHVLREALVAQLARGAITLELCVQNRGTRAIAIEDARVAWPVAPERLATLRLDPSGFGRPEQEELGERMSFNPWNALDEHRPLGAINAARKVVYRSLYELRTRLGGKLPFEPQP